MAFNFGNTYIQEQITLLQGMMKNNEQPLKIATLIDDGITITVHYDKITVEWNGGTGYGSGSDYEETLKAASDDSWRRIQRSQQG